MVYIYCAYCTRPNFVLNPFRSSYKMPSRGDLQMNSKLGFTVGDLVGEEVLHAQRRTLDSRGEFFAGGRRLGAVTRANLQRSRTACFTVVPQVQRHFEGDTADLDPRLRRGCPVVVGDLLTVHTRLGAAYSGAVDLVVAEEDFSRYRLLRFLCAFAGSQQVLQTRPPSVHTDAAGKQQSDQRLAKHL